MENAFDGYAQNAFDGYAQNAFGGYVENASEASLLVKGLREPH